MWDEAGMLMPSGSAQPMKWFDGADYPAPAMACVKDLEAKGVASGAKTWECVPMKQEPKLPPAMAERFRLFGGK